MAAARDAGGGALLTALVSRVVAGHRPQPPRTPPPADLPVRAAVTDRHEERPDGGRVQRRLVAVPAPRRSGACLPTTDAAPRPARPALALVR